MKRAVLLLLLGACHSKDITNGDQPPAPEDSSGTKIVYAEATDAATPDCAVHLVSEAFSPAHATLTGKVRVEGDYTRTLAKLSVERGGAAGHPSTTAWSGQFKGPRDAFFETLRRHVCTAAHVYALKAEGNKDPTKGAVVLDVYEMTPDEKADVDNLCQAVVRAPGAGAAEGGTARAPNADVRDHAVMTWVEDNLTTTKWDGWRRRFARDRGALLATKGNPRELFHARAAELESAAKPLGLACPTATEWSKR
jgi:hypothetical protein